MVKKKTHVKGHFKHKPGKKRGPKSVPVRPHRRKKKK